MAQNPNSIATRFSTDREEPCTALLAIRIPPSQKAKLKKMEGWQEKIRDFIDELTEPISA